MMKNLSNEIIKKRILLTVRDGSMYSFDFDILSRTSRQDCVLCSKNNPDFVCYGFDWHKGFVPVEPNKHIEIRIKGGLSWELLKNAYVDYPKFFVNVVGEEYDMYVGYPRLYDYPNLSYIEQVHNVIKNWSINAIYFYLHRDRYNFSKALQYSRFWYKENALQSFSSMLQIENITFSFLK